MEFDQNLLADLAASITEHCPNTIQQDNSGFIADRLAEHILELQEAKFEAFGHSNDTDTLRSVTDLLSEAIKKIDTLSESTKRKIDIQLPLPQSEQKNGLSKFGEVTELEDGKVKLTIPPYTKPVSTDEKHILCDYLDGIVLLSATIEELLDRKPYQGKKISKKLKYEGVLAAKACKTIWRDELRYRAIAEGAPMKSPNKYVKDEYDNDPMKAFIEEVFIVLGIKEKVSSMLNAIENNGGEDKLTVSIDIR